MKNDKQQTLFRQKSLDRISSPEQLNAYIRVSTPSVWMILAAVIVLLVGVCAWGVFGHMDTTLSVAVLAENGHVTAYVKEADAAKVAAGQAVTVAGAQGQVAAVSTEPQRVDDTFTDYMRHLGSLQEGEWVFAVTLDAALEDGVHAAQIVIDSVSPMSFVLN